LSRRIPEKTKRHEDSTACAKRYTRLHSLRLALNGRLPPFAKEAFLRLREIDASQRALPDFLIIGAQKAGTSSLFNYLCSHPERGERWYRRHFPKRSTLNDRSAICGEATPTSLYSKQAAELAQQLVPKAKIIALLREPAARAVSHYYHQVRAGVETRSIDEVFSEENIQRWRNGDCPDLPWRWYFKWSDYATGLNYWRSYFPEDQLLVLQAEAMFANPLEILNEVTKFLNIRPIELGEAKVFNQGQSEKQLPQAFEDLKDALAQTNAAVMNYN
jgi:hypothetical protein